MKINQLHAISTVPVFFSGAWILYSYMHHSPTEPVNPALLAAGSYYSVGNKLESQPGAKPDKYDAAIYIKPDDKGNELLVIKGYVTSPSITAPNAVLDFYPEGEKCYGGNFVLIQASGSATVNLELRSSYLGCEVVNQLQSGLKLKRLTN
ncbi:hypothetical protein WG29040_01510 [Pseudomonas sp. PAMC 29040]|uniref:hypothetical protein n=1 Tax=Pseudomonas sp. PAMC 29040 TaxID=2498450 RepID=UPI000FB44698|nr:hypothetical protein [Pseudomonas sp. PAMC 29040]RUT42300.1 hypothetical protein WG29040_01510 [Pseudomonas sp. PAMC 29040]